MCAIRPLIFCISLVLSVSNAIAQQHSIAIALTSDGIYLNSADVKDDGRGASVNPVPDTISLTVAKSIYSVLGIRYLEPYQFEKLNVTAFNLTIIHPNGETIKHVGSSCNINDQMKNSLATMIPNSKLFIDGIQYYIKTKPESKGQLMLMKFIVK